MGAVLRICIAEYARQTAHRTAYRHGPVRAPYNIFTLLAKTPFCGRLVILSQTAEPRQIHPAHCRASVMLGYCLQSINRQMGAPGLQTFLASESHSAIQRSSFADPSDRRQNLAGHYPYPYCCISDWSCGFSPRPSSRPKRRAGPGYECIEYLRLECPDNLQGVAVQDAPSVSAAVFHRQHGFIYDLCQFVCFGQRHLPFCYRSVSERFFGFVGVFSDNSVFTYSLMMVRAL